MTEPVSVPSDVDGGVTTQRRPATPVNDLLRRMAILEKTARNNSAAIGSGGIALYDGGTFRWFNYNYDNQLPPDDPSNVDAMVFEIGSFEETDLEDFGAALHYYFPNKADRSSLPVAVMGAFEQVDDTTKDSHGLAVYAIGGNPTRPVFAASDDGVVLQKSSDRDPQGGPQTILKALKDADDQLNLFGDNEQVYLSVYTDANERAYIGGGNSGADTGGLMVIYGTEGGASDREFYFVRADDVATGVEIHAAGFDVYPSSVDAKNVTEEVREDDYLSTVTDVPIKTWTLKADTEPEPVEHFSPIVEDMPEHLVTRASDPAFSDGIKLDKVVWTLWGAVQQLTAQVEALTADKMKD